MAQKKLKTVTRPGTTLSPDEIEFFEAARRVINNNAVYNEFLKIVNLFNNEIIDVRTLIERVDPFLSKNPEVWDFFKKMVKYEDEEAACTVILLLFSIPICSLCDINVSFFR